MTSFFLKNRYKFYLEPEEDENPQGNHKSAVNTSLTDEPPRVPLQEKPVSSYYPEAIVATPVSTMASKKPRPRMITTTSKMVSNPVKKRSETLCADDPCVLTGVKTRPTPSGTLETPGTSGLRMGTRISASALHRERLRLASELGLPGTHFGTVPPPPMLKHKTNTTTMFSDDATLMETKSLLPRPPNPTAYVVHTSINTSQDDPANNVLPFSLNQDSLSDSLLDRFDAMETDEPERQIVSVTLHKDPNGKLGLKITGTPSGIYVEDYQHREPKLKHGDRIVAINGRSLENVSYQGALDLIRKSTSAVQFIVSQITTK